MKIRAIGTGSSFCRHPLVTPCFLVQTSESNIVIGCGPNIPAKLESIGIDSVDMWVIPSTSLEQVGGLLEVLKDSRLLGNPYLVGPANVLSCVESTLRATDRARLSDRFNVQPAHRIRVEDENTNETIKLIQRTEDLSQGHDILFEDAKLFISNSAPSEDPAFLENLGKAKLILQRWDADSCFSDTLPQDALHKTWLFAYPDHYRDLTEHKPLLFLPQGTCAYDSTRRDAYLDKERFVREAGRRLLGTQASAHHKLSPTPQSYSDAIKGF